MQIEQVSMQVHGQVTELNGEAVYQIENVDQMPPFFTTLLSDQDHWLFAASNGGLTMGRVSPDTAVFPYVTVDKIYESTLHTGPRSLIKVTNDEGKVVCWQPFNYALDGTFSTTRNLYKNLLGNALYFEEINHDLALKFRYVWRFSDEFGIARQCLLENLGEQAREIKLLDGIQNILPAGTPRYTQTQSSNLVDAYKWTELDTQDQLALFTLYSAITDRAEPVEALRATSVFHFGLDNASVQLSANSIAAFIKDQPLPSETSSRGVRGAYLVASQFSLAAKAAQSWTQVVNVEQDQAQIVALKQALQNTQTLEQKLLASIDNGSDQLARIMASADGFQSTNEPMVGLHHYANTLFNVLRGGIFADQYQLSRADISKTIKHFNQATFARTADAIAKLPEQVSLQALHAFLSEQHDNQLTRLLSEYLPITFGRRHGDPSRPWNQFAIQLKDELGSPLLSYQGNWRDIFQNWEALCLSYPDFIESVIAKFVNASTIDGYNPYRITKQGIDWEVEEPDDPWSYIGYWGDHQIIYLLKLLEWSHKFHPGTLAASLSQTVYCYANVPYRIKDYDALVNNPKDTIRFDDDLAALIEARVAQVGADGKLVLDASGEVYQVTLLEKLLVPLLAKLSNLVVDGGIWLNTQRPEWNDANNALVGQGLSMVTLYYLNRYLAFMQDLLTQAQADGQDSYLITSEIADWLVRTSDILAKAAAQLTDAPATSSEQQALISALGKAASEYRQQIYQHTGSYSQTSVTQAQLSALIEAAKQLVTHSIEHNLAENGLYHAYNVLSIAPESLHVGHLYPMLEGQVSALSSGALSPQQALQVTETLFAGDMFRDDQLTFMLYPDREQQGFLTKNQLDSERVDAIGLVRTMLDNGDTRLVKRDTNNHYRFNADISNAAALAEKFAVVAQDYPQQADSASLVELQALYEQVFNHQAFTGRSGGMFGFEGLGCIYWHMVSKLLLAVQECAMQSAAEDLHSDTTQALIKQYYRVREGIGFNKTPSEYGAFPADPYSHTPKHAGAQQPGMTGQVKEELLTRLNELGCFVEQGQVEFAPYMLRVQEFLTQADTLKYLDVAGEWQTLELSAGSLAFTWCQVPIIYHLADDAAASPSAEITLTDGQSLSAPEAKLDTTSARSLFARDGKIARIDVHLGREYLYQAD